jgi:hypothetical protein
MDDGCRPASGQTHAGSTELFGSKALFRCSFTTKDEGEVFAVAKVAHGELERPIAGAVINADRAAIVDRDANVTEQPFETYGGMQTIALLPKRRDFSCRSGQSGVSTHVIPVKEVHPR